MPNWKKVIVSGSEAALSSLSLGDISNVSSSIAELQTYKESVSGATSYTITHNLNENYPFVQCWNTSNREMELPASISSSDANEVVVSFGSLFTGQIIVRR